MLISIQPMSFSFSLSLSLCPSLSPSLCFTLSSPVIPLTPANSAFVNAFLTLPALQSFDAKGKVMNYSSLRPRFSIRATVNIPFTFDEREAVSLSPFLLHFSHLRLFSVSPLCSALCLLFSLCLSASLYLFVIHLISIFPSSKAHNLSNFPQNDTNCICIVHSSNRTI